MRSIFACTAGFACLFLFDWLQLHKRSVLARLCSGIGYIAIIIGLFLLLVSYKMGSFSSLFLFIKLAGATLFFALLIYSVFIEIGLKSPYVESDERTAVITGTYGLVRHPGFLWFAGLLLILISIYRDWEFSLIAASIIAMNFILVLMEDLILFPKLFTNYGEYKKTVPFIIPRINSIYRLLRSINEETD